MSRTTAEPADAGEAPTSRAVVVLTGLAYLFVGIGFSYLDRRFGSFGFEALLWIVWALLGFGAGTALIGKPTQSGQVLWRVLGALGFVFVILPLFPVYNLLRWGSLSLMVVVGARAVILRTRRDFYLTLTVIFVVSFMVGTHGNANWTLWFYLGPAWLFGALALTWEYTSGTSIPRWIRLLMTLGFVGLAFLLAAMLFLFAPRPPILGFGFLPPGTDPPGLFQQPTAQGGSNPAKGGSDNGAADTGTKEGTGASPAGGAAQDWRAMLDTMRRAMSDSYIPAWQRSLMGQLLDSAQGAVDGLAAAASGSAEAGQLQGLARVGVFYLSWWTILLALLALVTACLMWWRRYRIGLEAALGLSWLLTGRFPTQSMRLSALAMKWCLHSAGHARSPGQSVREHWLGAAAIAPLARRWLGYAMEAYCAMRFGGVAATAQGARHMRTAVQGACDILAGIAPELKR